MQQKNYPSMTAASYDLSIIVPYFNAEDYLEACLESIASITGIRFELILVNDGSTDGSQQVVHNFPFPPEIQVTKINQDNAGVSVARNNAISSAQGTYLLFIDSDDFISADALKNTFISTLESNLDFVTTSYYQVTGKNEFLVVRPLDSSRIVSGFKLLSCCVARGSFRTELCINLYKRSVIQKYNLKFVPGIYYEDALFIAQFLYFCNKTAFIPTPFYYYRQHATSAMADRGSSEKVRSESYVIRLLFEFYKTHNIKDKWWNDFLLSRYYRMVRFRGYKDKTLTKEILFLRPLPPRGWAKKLLTLFLLSRKIHI